MYDKELKSHYELIKDTPYLSLTCELWGVYWVYFEKIWFVYKKTTLYEYMGSCTVFLKEM